MTVWQRIARFATVGVAVGTLTACTSLTGWLSEGTNPAPRSNGWTQTVNFYLAAYLIGGNYHSRTGAVQNTSGTIKEVQARHLIHGATDCFWTNVSCNGVATKKLDGNIYATTSDTSGDGYVSGAPDWYPQGSNCGAYSAATYSTAFPASAIFQDKTNCAYYDANYASVESISSSLQGWGSTASETGGQAHRMLSLEAMQGLMNSLDASDIRTVVVGGVPMDLIRAQVTKVSVGGESYKPVNVFIEVYNWKMTKWDMTKEPGLKLMAAWIANKMEGLLDRGATSIRFAVELNNGVTLTRADLPGAIGVTEPSYAAVEGLRNFATTQVRD